MKDAIVHTLAEEAMASKNVEPLDSELPLGTRVLNEYTILGKLAQGGMAEVYLAQKDALTTPELCVLKRVRPHLSNDKDFVAMFTNEARLAAQINHHNVVNIHTLSKGGPSSKDWFLAMEYLDGRDMLQIGRACRAHNKAVPFYVTARIIADACAGLDFAHGLTSADGQHLNLVHRDMSPENIVITFDGSVKVVDFGIAKAKDNSYRTQAGQIKGKLGYVAPEAILGKTLDARADIFAIGATLYLFLCGRPAFGGVKPMEIFENSLKPPTPPTEVNARVPLALEKICMRCLAREREDRYQSALELKEALELYLTSTGRPLGPAQLAQFMQVIFPKDGDKERQRISALIEKGRALSKPADISGIMPVTDSRFINGEHTMVTNPSNSSDHTYAPANIEFNHTLEGEHEKSKDETMLSADAKKKALADVNIDDNDDFNIDMDDLSEGEEANAIPLPSPASLAAAKTPPAKTPVSTERAPLNTLIRDRVSDPNLPNISVKMEALEQKMEISASKRSSPNIGEGQQDIANTLNAVEPASPNPPLASAELPPMPEAPVQPTPSATTTGSLANDSAAHIYKTSAPTKSSFGARALAFSLGGAFAILILGLLFHFSGLLAVAWRVFDIA